ncbi:MAG: radical SAM family heme chaperone HemW, partial [bacterium]|nr:radical SAM family heme chaperone HemW [bacterium]
MHPHSLYIHWPFCPYRCHFCPFVALAGQDQFMKEYHQALLQEMEQFASNYSQKIQLETIYIGGGTPSTYPNELLLDTFGRLISRFSFNEKTEVTIELNPGTVNKQQLQLWKTVGINRLSIGVQSLNESVLHSLNRKQNTSDIFFVLEHARPLFTNISIDIILGLPGISNKEWKILLQKVVTWPITHISMYFLTVHEKTPLYFKVKTNEVELLKDGTMLELYYWSCDFLAKHGFEHYEISSFARSGYQSRHNNVYWARVPYKAFGLGACSFDGITRFQNEKNLTKYLEGVQRGNDITSFSEELTDEQIHIEKVMLGLRRMKGVMGDVLLEGLSEQKKLLVLEKVTIL